MDDALLLDLDLAPGHDVVAVHADLGDDRLATATPDSGVVALDLASWVERVPDDGATVDLRLERRSTGGATVERLGRFASTTRPDAPETWTVAGRTVEVVLTDAGNVSLRVGLPPLLRARITTRTLDVGPAGVTVEADVDTFARPLSGASARWIARQSDLTQELPVALEPVDPSDRHGLHRYRLRATLPPPPDDGTSAHLDLRLLLEHVGADAPVMRGLPTAATTRARLRDVVTTSGDDVVVRVPFGAFRTTNLAFHLERRDVATQRTMRRVALLGRLLRPVRPFLGVWLVGELPARAQDNGWQHFAWLREHHPRRRAYYVIAPSSGDAARVQALGNVVAHGSRRHAWLTVLASRFVGTHHAEYLYASRSAGIVRAATGVRVFLQHGVTAMKNVTATYGRTTTIEQPADLVMVNGRREHRIFVERMGFAEDQVVDAGFTRFDSLFAEPLPPPRRVLVMPTWRDWLTRGEDFDDSLYLARWSALLRRDELQEVVAKVGGTSVDLVLHPNVWHRLDAFEVPGVTVHPPGSVDVQTLVREAAVLVTDYSSVGFDAAFLGRPVVFYAFDRDRLVGRREPFVDLDRELPGDVVVEEDDAVAAVLAAAARGFAASAEATHRAGAFLDHHDRLNNQRTYDAVRRRLGPRALLRRRGRRSR